MKKTLLFLFALVTMATHAQTPGDVAQSYGIPGTGFNGAIYSIVLQADGKILIGGSFTTYNGATENRIIRLNTDGSKDTAFNTGSGFNSNVTSIAQQADGKILIGGSFTNYNGVTKNSIIRLNTDGSNDTTFNTGTGVGGLVYSIELQTDGKILVGGLFSSFNGVTEYNIIRLNADGSKDTTFNTGTGIGGNVFLIKQQPNGKILIGGPFDSYNGTTENCIIRLNSDGTKDVTFNTGTGFDLAVETIALQADGKILVGGDFTTYIGITENNIIRLNSDGTKDTTFNAGSGFIGNVYTIKQLSDGKILVGGAFTTFNGVTENRIIRLNTDGSKDTSFNTGTGFNSSVWTIAQQSDGKIVIGGQFNTYNGVTENNIIRLNTDGTKDTTFNNGQFNNIIRTTEEQTNGKILVGGDFTSYKGVTENRIIRLNSDGTKDTEFITGTGFDGAIYTIKKQTDGKILVGGEFTSFNGVVSNRIIRLNANGTIDTSFSTGTGFEDIVRTIKIQADGKILIGGLFTTYNGGTVNRIIRLNADGTKDTTFISAISFNNPVYVIEQQADGKILVGGAFTSYNGTSVNRFVRLETNGSIDNTFTIGTGFSSTVVSVELQTDGKILVGGFFISYKGVTANKIIRLNTDGSKDTTFNIGTGFNTGTGNAVRAIELQNDGKIVVGGNFTSYNGVTENRIITLNSDGSKNTAFINGSGFDGDVWTIEQLADGKILVGGDFSTYKGNSTSAYLIKLHTEQSLSTTSFDAANTFIIYPNPVQDVLHLQANNFTSIKAVKIYDLQGKVVLEDTNDTINVSNLSNGLYIIKVTTKEGEFTKKFIKE
jgi:uncharacterized delta-60 repeat protein